VLLPLLLQHQVRPSLRMIARHNDRSYNTTKIHWARLLQR
jgi:hypothetical protein